MTVFIKTTIVISVNFLFFLSMLPNSIAQNNDELIEHVQARYEKTVTIQSEFSQDSFISSLDKNQRAQGKVFIKKPGFMRWEYEEPEKQLIVTNKEHVFIYIPEDNQVIQDNVLDLFSSSVPAAFLAGTAKLKDKFLITFPKNKSKEKNFHTLILIPKVKQPTLVKMILRVDKTTYQIVESEIYDVYENKTTIQFFNIKINTDIKNTLFNFKIPKGADVITKPTFN